VSPSGVTHRPWNEAVLSGYLFFETLLLLMPEGALLFRLTKFNDVLMNECFLTTLIGIPILRKNHN